MAPAPRPATPPWKSSHDIWRPRSQDVRPQSPASKDSQAAFKAYTPKLEKPMFFPRVVRAQARIGAMAQLTGSSKFNQMRWNSTYAERGFDTAANKGEVFLDLPQTPDMARARLLQAGRSQRWLCDAQPEPQRAVARPRANRRRRRRCVDRQGEPTGFFPPGASALPLPLLFGCIPLSAVIRRWRTCSTTWTRRPSSRPRRAPRSKASSTT